MKYGRYGTRIHWELPAGRLTVPTHVRPIRASYVFQTHYQYGEKPCVWREGEVS